MPHVDSSDFATREREDATDDERRAGAWSPPRDAGRNADARQSGDHGERQVRSCPSVFLLISFRNSPFFLLFSLVTVGISHHYDCGASARPKKMDARSCFAISAVGP